jgi:hypothetical protein
MTELFGSNTGKMGYFASAIGAVKSLRVGPESHRSEQRMILETDRLKRVRGNERSARWSHSDEARLEMVLAQLGSQLSKACVWVECSPLPWRTTTQRVSLGCGRRLSRILGSA